MKRKKQSENVTGIFTTSNNLIDIHLPSHSIQKALKTPSKSLKNNSTMPDIEHLTVPEEFKRYLFKPELSHQEVAYVVNSIPFLSGRPIYVKDSKGDLELDENGNRQELTLPPNLTPDTRLHGTNVTYRVAILMAYAMMKDILMNSPLDFVLEQKENQSEEKKKKKDIPDNYAARVKGRDSNSKKQKISLGLVGQFNKTDLMKRDTSCIAIILATSILSTSSTVFKEKKNTDPEFSLGISVQKEIELECHGKYFLEDLFRSCTWIYGNRYVSNDGPFDFAAATSEQKIQRKVACGKLYSTIKNINFNGQVKMWRLRVKTVSWWTVEYLKQCLQCPTMDAPKGRDGFYDHLKILDMILDNMFPDDSEQFKLLDVDEQACIEARNWQHDNQRQWHKNAGHHQDALYLFDNNTQQFPTQPDDFPSFVELEQHATTPIQDAQVYASIQYNVNDENGSQSHYPVGAVGMGSAAGLRTSDVAEKTFTVPTNWKIPVGSSVIVTGGGIVPDDNTHSIIFEYCEDAAFAMIKLTCRGEVALVRKNLASIKLVNIGEYLPANVNLITNLSSTEDSVRRTFLVKVFGYGIKNLDSNINSNEAWKTWKFHAVSQDGQVHEFVGLKKFQELMVHASTHKMKVTGQVNNVPNDPIER